MGRSVLRERQRPASLVERLSVGNVSSGGGEGENTRTTDFVEEDYEVAPGEEGIGTELPPGHEGVLLWSRGVR